MRARMEAQILHTVFQYPGVDSDPAQRKRRQATLWPQRPGDQDQPVQSLRATLRGTPPIDSGADGNRVAEMYGKHRARTLSTGKVQRIG
jgi:hypothetical protein